MRDILIMSLAFLSPTLIKAAIEGRVLRGIGVEQLRNLSPEWDRQLEVFGLSSA